MAKEDLFESVPNFSEGRRGDVIDAIAAAAAAEARVLDTDADPDHNRVVVSIAGSRSHVVDALLVRSAPPSSASICVRTAGCIPASARRT